MGAANSSLPSSVIWLSHQLMTGNLKTSPSAQTQMRKAKGKADKGSRSLLLYAAPHHLTPQKSFHKEKNFSAKNEKLVKFSSTISHVFQLPSQRSYLWQLSGQKLSKILFPPKKHKNKLAKKLSCTPCWMRCRLLNDCERNFFEFCGLGMEFFVPRFCCCFDVLRSSPFSYFVIRAKAFRSPLFVANFHQTTRLKIMICGDGFWHVIRVWLLARVRFREARWWNGNNNRDDFF